MTSDAATPPSPSASFYDVSDDEEGEYNTITHTSTRKGVKLLFSKSKVCKSLIEAQLTSSNNQVPPAKSIMLIAKRRSTSTLRPLQRIMYLAI